MYRYRIDMLKDPRQQQLLVDLTDIVSITKRSLALVIPNAIEIETPTAKVRPCPLIKIGIPS